MAISSVEHLDSHIDQFAT